MKDTEKVLKVSEACEILQINRMTFYSLVRHNLLEVIDINKGALTEEGWAKRPRYRVTMAAIKKYLVNQKVVNPVL